MADMEYYRSRLSMMLGEKRYHHSLCVAERAEYLAERHGADREKAALAGLLHDICHDMPEEEQLKYLSSHDILLDKLTMEHPSLWHAVCGAAYLEHELGIDDPEVLSAVRYHTTGRGGMTRLEQAVFLADCTSRDRSYPGAEKARRLADGSPEDGMLCFLGFELARLAGEGRTIVKDAVDAYNYFAYGRGKKTR